VLLFGMSKIEALLFLASDGVTVDFLVEKLEMKQDKVEEALSELKKKYSGDSGIHLIKFRNAYQLSTNPAFAEEIAVILNPVREKALTRSSLETLAIIAYKQPLTRLEIEDIRGVDSSYALQILAQNNMVEVVGRRDTVGNPLIYATTDEFLKRFELECIENLPSYDQLIEKIKIISSGLNGLDNS